MNYLKFSVGSAGPGTVVEVTLRGVESDVYLVDAPNLTAMQAGRSFQRYGGHYRASPIRLGVPHHANWTAVVVPVGGKVSASARILHGAGV